MYKYIQNYSSKEHERQHEKLGQQIIILKQLIE